jgi:hypothetical protein
VNDDENRILSNRLHTFWKGLQLAWSSTPRSTAWILTGSLKNEKPDVSQLTSLFPTFDKTPPVSLSPAVLRLAAETSVDLERTFASGLLSGRVERGLTSFFSSMGSGYLDDSILALERAIEGIVHPSDRKQFVKRCATILRLGPSHDLNAVLEEIYTVRNAFTHAALVDLAFPGRTPAQARHRAQQLQALLYSFAAGAFRSIIADVRLIEQFSSEGQGPFWGSVVEGKRQAPFVVTVADDQWQFGEDELASS